MTILHKNCRLRTLLAFGVVASIHLGCGDSSRPVPLEDLDVVATTTETYGSESASEEFATLDENSPATRLALGASPVQDGYCTHDDTCDIHRPVRFFKQRYFEGDSWEPEIPYITESDANGRIYYWLNTPPEWKDNIKSYWLKGNCEFYHYEGSNFSGRVHGKYYGTQYLAMSGVPSKFRGFKIRCWDDRQEQASLFSEEDFGGQEIKLWNDFDLDAFDSSLQQTLWTSGGIGSVALNTAVYPMLTLSVRTPDNKLVAAVYSDRENGVTDQPVDEATFDTDQAARCEPLGHCWPNSEFCDPGRVSVPTSIDECEQRRITQGSPVAAYCNAGGFCVDPGDGDGILR